MSGDNSSFQGESEPPLICLIILMYDKILIGLKIKITKKRLC